MQPLLDRDSDRLGEPGRLVEPCADVAPRLAELGQRDHRPGAARKLVVGLAIEDAQPLTPRPPGPRRS